jgi:DNA-binding transcriptional LysR family regulator
MRRSNGTLAHWRLEQPGGTLELAVSGSLIVNDFPTMLTAALGGLALAQVPEPIAREPLAAGQLEEALAGHAPSTSGVFLYFPHRTQVLPKLRAFIDHVRAQTAALPPAAVNAPTSSPGSRKSRPPPRRKSAPRAG